MNTVFLFIGYPEIVLICLIIILLFGAKKIPELMKGIGKGVREFNKAKDEILDTNQKDKEGNEENK